MNSLPLPSAPLSYAETRELVIEILGERAIALQTEGSGYDVSRAILDAAVICFLEQRDDEKARSLRDCLKYLNTHGYVSNR